MWRRHSAERNAFYYLLFPRPFHQICCGVWPQRKDLLFRVHCSLRGLSASLRFEQFTPNWHGWQESQAEPKANKKFVVSILSHSHMQCECDGTWWNYASVWLRLANEVLFQIRITEKKKKISCIICIVYVSIYFQQKQISWIICAQRLFTSLPPAQQTKSIHTKTTE